MSPNYKKGGGDVACWAAASPKRFCRGRDTGVRRELPCLARPAPARVVSEKTRETKKKTNRRESRGALLRSEPLSIDQHSTAQHSRARQGRPKQGS